MTDKENKVYEVSFNIVPTLSEEEVASAFGNIKDSLAKLGAEIISEQYPRPINLAYSMAKVIANKNYKFTSAHFGWVKFAASASFAAELKQLLDQDGNIIRFLIIKTVRENTLAPKKIMRPEGRSRRTQAPAEAVELDQEAVDKKLEEMTVA